MPLPTKEQSEMAIRHDYLMGLIEQPYANAIVREKNRYIRAVAHSYDTLGVVSEGLLVEHINNMREISDRYNTRIIRIFCKEFIRTQIKAANKSGALVLKALEYKQDQFDLFVDHLFAYWVLNYTGVQAKETAETTHEDIKKAVAGARLSGETASGQVAKRILRVRDISPFRAEAIARTETHNAAMYATKESAVKLQVDGGVILNKKWIPVTDGRTRETHAHMKNHDTIPMESKFHVGASLMDRPGDPAGSARNVINCRCTIAFEVVE